MRPQISSSSAPAPRRFSFVPSSLSADESMRRVEKSRSKGATVRADRVNSQRPGAPNDANDAALVAAIARGDRDAMAQLYDRYAALLLGLASRVVGDRVHAEDVLH